MSRAMTNGAQTAGNSKLIWPRVCRLCWPHPVLGFAGKFIRDCVCPRRAPGSATLAIRATDTPAFTRVFPLASLS